MGVAVCGLAFPAACDDSTECASGRCVDAQCAQK
jgi:hypothetical protein